MLCSILKLLASVVSDKIQIGHLRLNFNYHISAVYNFFYYIVIAAHLSLTMSVILLPRLWVILVLIMQILFCLTSL